MICKFKFAILKDYNTSDPLFIFELIKTSIQYQYVILFQECFSLILIKLLSKSMTIVSVFLIISQKKYIKNNQGQDKFLSCLLFMHSIFMYVFPITSFTIHCCLLDIIHISFRQVLKISFKCCLNTNAFKMSQMMIIKFINY